MADYELSVALGALALGAAAIVYANWSVRNLERKLASQARESSAAPD
jgi:hypothetical protein